MKKIGCPCHSAQQAKAGAGAGGGGGHGEDKGTGRRCGFCKKITIPAHNARSCPAKLLKKRSRLDRYEDTAEDSSSSDEQPSDSDSE